MNDYVFSPAHKGLFCGIVPVNLDMTDEECPGIEVRGSGVIKFALEILMDVVEGILALYIQHKINTDPDYEPAFPIKITGEIIR